MRQTILFLFRTYNDIDHIVPVAWKVVNSGASVAFLFVSSDLSHDYRIEFLVQAGARKLESKLIRRYFENIRNKTGTYRTITPNRQFTWGLTTLVIYVGFSHVNLCKVWSR